MCAGLGARVTHWLKHSQVDQIGRALLGILTLRLVLYSFWVPDLLRATIGTTLGVRVGIALALLCPIAALMGTALPCGIRRVESDSKSLIPWVWAVNGAMTVLGSVLAIILSMNVGIAATLLAGAAAY